MLRELFHWDSSTKEEKKRAKIKKKLMNLEVERCYQKINQTNLSEIDHKIDSQKQAYNKLCQQSKGS